MKAPTPAPTPERVQESRARKRTREQREADLTFIGSQVIRGCPQVKIAEALAKVRPYRISRSQVRDDIHLLLKRWREEGIGLLGSAVDVALRKLDALEADLWDEWDKSKTAQTRTSLRRKTRGGQPTGTGPAETDQSAVTTSAVGNPAIVRAILEVIDRRAKLLGLDAPARHELSGPGGAPIATVNASVPVTEEHADALLERHFQRMLEEREERAEAETAKRKASEAGADEAADG